MAGGQRTGEFVPKLFTLLRAGISREQLSKDVLSGVIVGIVALPLAIAFAIASGVSPEKGLITAIIAGFVVSAFGGSRVQIGGPTGAFIVIVYGIVQKYGVDGLTTATFIAGFLIMIMGFLRFGQLLKYFPFTLIVGFTAGIAVIILSSQIKELLGLKMGPLPAHAFDQWVAYATNLSSVNAYALVLGVSSVLLTLFMTRVSRVVPGSLVAIIACTLAVHFLHWPVETIESRFGAIPRTLPMPTFKALDLATVRELIQPALAIALLGSIESLLSAVVADGMIGGRHRSNMELVAQGGANVLSALFGGIPATGAIARTATNAKNGGRTPIAGIVHALTLLLIMLLAAPMAGKIPLACLAGILVVVAYNMSEWRTFLSILRGNRYDIAVLLATFGITVIFDLVLAIEVGMVLAAFLFMKRMSDITDLAPVMNEGGDERLLDEELRDLPKDMLVFEISGPLFFGAAQKFQDVLGQLSDRHRVLVLRMKHVPLIDATGMHRLKEIVQHMRSRKRKIYITDVGDRVMSELLEQDWFEAGLVERSVADVVKRVRQAGT